MELKYIPTMLQTKKQIIIPALLLFFFLALTWISYDWYKDHKEEKKINVLVQEIIAHVNIPQEASFHQKIDHIRAYIIAHSELNMNDEFYSIWRSHEKILSTFLAGIKKERDTFVPLECATRTGIMQDIAKNLGYDVRTSYAYNGLNSKLEGHVLIDLLNPETGKWESQDPRFDLYWINKTTKERASFVDIVGQTDIFEPCNAQKCGWDIISSENEVAERLRDYTSIVTTVDKKNKIRKTTFDANQIPADKQFTLNNQKGTYCDLIEKNCRNGFTPNK